MRKVLVLCVVLLLAGGIFCHADELRIKALIKAEHGEDLTRADFPVRYKFLQRTGIEWQSSTYEQREDFLTKWYEELEVKNKAQAELDQAEKEEEMEVAAQKKAEADELLAREQERLMDERLEEQAREEEKKDFNSLVRDRGQNIINMRQNER